MNILHAHTDPPLVERLTTMLDSSVRADIAVGYLFMSGFNAVAPQLERLDKVRVLVGRTDRATLDEVASGLQQAEALRARVEGDGLVQRSARSAIGARATRTIGEGVARLPQDAASERGVACLRDLIAAGRLELKTYPKGMLHAKAYLCWYRDHAEPGAAIVGSSNFTLAGFTGNTELNVRVTGDAEMAELGRWFDGLWADAVDVTDAVKVELERSWALAATPPYHVYLKALYELYRDELGAPELQATKRGAPELANFQLDAVRRALRMVEAHGGCYIGDVVGLGKTYIGAELARQLQFDEPPGRYPLIICPAGLKPMWETVSERFGLGAAVVSMSTIVPPAGASYDAESEAYIEGDDVEPAGGIDLTATYPNRGVVLVDEAHNFRTPGTRRYRALFDYLWGGEHKTVLLSATPQNLGPSDIYQQLRLFLDDLDHGLNLEPLHLQEYFAAVRRWYAYRTELENWQADYARWQVERAAKRGKKEPPPAPPTQPDVPYATIEQVLNPVFLRRRRKDIKELYGDDIMVAGKRVQFPTPALDNLTYRLDKVYAKAGSLDDIQQSLKRHHGARYLAVEYLQPAAREKEQYRDLLRARNRVARLMRHLLFKRLESSVEAFRATLGVLVRSNANFRAALEAGYVPIGQTAATMLAGVQFDADDLLHRLGAEEGRRKATGAKKSTLVHPAADFDTARWLADLDRDHAILAELQRAVARISPDDDDKLRRLRRFLDQPEVAGGKVLIFSEAEATVTYLYEQLNPGGADPTIAMLSGSNRDALQSTIRRFAPRANGGAGHLSGPEVRVLIATDVISEGQNLQDCNRVLNYDLHWNPVRLIQRFGRVDRIGTTHETIYLHNAWPDTAVDAELALTARLHNRIQAFHDFIGLDTQLLSDSERVNPAAMYRIYEQKRLPEEGEDALDEVAAHQRGIALLQNIQQQDLALWRAITELPDGIRAALAAPEPPTVEQTLIDFQLSFERPAQLPLTIPIQEAGVRSPLDAPGRDETVALLKEGGRPLAYAIGSDLRPRPLTSSQLLSAMECAPATPPRPLPADTNERVMAAYAAARHDAATRIGRIRRPSTDTRLRRYLARELKLLREAAGTDPEELKRAGALQQIFVGHLPASVLAELNEARRMETTGPALARRLEAIRERYRLNPPEANGGQPTEVDVMRIVCSDGLV